MRSPAASVRSVVVVAMVGIFVAIALTTSMGADASSYTTSSYSARLLSLVNEVRQQHGVQPLKLVPGTTAVAAGWTDHLAAAQMLSHNPRLAHQLSTHGSHSWLAYGENVGMGSAQDPDALFDAYMNSPEHRANILSGDYRFVGVAVVFTGDRAWNTFDFVDVYRTPSVQPVAHQRARPGITRVHHAAASHPATRTVATYSVAPAAPATASTPPVRPTRRAARPAGPVVVHVKALRHHAVRAPVVRLAAEPLAAFPVALDEARGHRTGSHQQLVAIAAAVMCLVFGSRRWLLVTVSRRDPVRPA